MKRLRILRRWFKRRFGYARLLCVGLLIGLAALRVADPAAIEEFRVRTFDTFQVIDPRKKTAKPVRIVNIDENEKPAVDELALFVPHIVVTHPLAPGDNPALYRLLGGIFDCTGRADQLCAEFTRAQEAAVTACAALPGVPAHLKSLKVTFKKIKKGAVSKGGHYRQLRPDLVPAGH